MVGIILFELIYIVSLFFSLWLSFFEFAASNNIFLVFLWIVFASLAFALIHTKSRIGEISILLLLMPLIFYRDRKSIFFIILVTAFIYLYIKKSLLEGSHHEYAYKIKRTYILCAILGYLSIKLFGVDGYISTALPFFTIYLISSLILLRTIRHIDSNLDLGNIRKNNTKYLIFMAVVFLIIASEKLRIFIWTSFNGMLNKLLITMVYPLYLIGSLLGRYIEKIKKDPELLSIVISKMEDIKKDLKLEEIVEEAVVLDFTILKIISALILFIIVAFIVYRLIMRTSTKIYSTISYTEEREFMKKTNKKKRRRWFFREKYPEDLREQVRFFYRRYLEKLKNKDIEIAKSDTSFDINKKAKEVFNHGIDDIRKIYIRCRYGNKKVTKEDVDNIKNLYENL
ncbi:MAG: hypothetical protein GXZ06_05750 [Tissierellia bacterium]|nr:hypothetical protein [Tissierellia bacterium]